MKELFVIIASCLLFCSDSYSTNVECAYGTESWEGIGHVYACTVKNILDIISSETAVIDSATGTNYKSVTFFHVDTKGQIHYFPRGLDVIFPNLVGISIYSCGLKEIKQSDVKPFPKIRHFNLYNNNIETLEDGLFEFNPRLEVVSFESNKLVHIDLHVFDHLSQLSFLYLNDNPCINLDAQHKEDIKSVVNQAKKLCQSPDYLTITEEFKVLEESLENLSAESLPIFRQKLRKFIQKFQSSKFVAFLAFKDRFRKLSEVEFEDVQEVAEIVQPELAKRIEDVENDLRELKSDLKDLENKLMDQMAVLMNRLANVTVAA